jgi:Carboxypeptidase regulatory-like domain/TonB dependent receptor
MSFATSLRSLFSLLCVLCLSITSNATTGFAQTSAATLTGIVLDPTGAVLPNVSISVTNTDWNTSYSTRTNEVGHYILPALNPGNYSIVATLPGFKRFVREGVVLQVSQVGRIDVRLDLGSVEETIEVTEASPLLHTETSERGSVIDQQKILGLPLNGRDYNQLATLASGVAPSTPRLAAVNFRGALNVNGNRVFNNVFLLDGVDNVSYSSSYRGDNVQVVQPSLEALREFKVQTNTSSAEFGRGSGAIVNATIRSGSNSVRGTVYEFLRNDALDANNFFSNAFGTPKPVRQRNQFGAALGGPVVRDKIFWFADYEALREREGVPQTRAIPSVQEKSGLFNSPVFDPFAVGKPMFSRDESGQWVIPRDRWDPVAARIVDLIPDPNVPGTNVYASTPITRTRSDQFDIRLDYQTSSTTQFFGRYSFLDSNVFRPSPLPGLADGSYSDAFGSNDNRSQGIALGLTRVFSLSFVGDFRLGWTRGNYFTAPPNDGIDGAAMVGLRNVPNNPDIIGGLPKIAFQGLDSIGRHTSTPQFQIPETWNPRLTFSSAQGRHFLKFGFEFLKVQTKINDLTAPIGAMSFAGLFSGRSVGDFLLGLPSVFALTSYTVIDQGQRMYFSFLQDDYKISHKLTLNLGVRYEYSTPPIEKENRLANFDPLTGSMQFAKNGSTFDRSLIHPDRNDWAPRVGFSYSPTPRLVLRGGYGVFYSHTVRQGREGMLGFNPPFLVDNLIIANVFGPTAVASAAPFRLADGYPQGLLDPNNLSPFVYRRAQDPNQRSPYVLQFNFGIQREVTSNLLLDVAYVGNKAAKLPGLRNINAPTVIENPNGSQSAGPRPYSGFGDIQWMENRVLSNYHSLQVGLEKRFSSGLSALASYTWGKALSEGADHLSTSFAGPGVDIGVFGVPQNTNELKAERGPAEFDVRHRFVVSYVYELPWGRNRHWGQSWNRTADLLFGNWQLSGIHVVQSGLPLTATLSGSTVLNLGSDRISRPNLVGDPELPRSHRTVERWFNTDAFTIPGPAPQAFGNAGVGIMRGPGLANFDFSIAKNIHLDENRYFQFRTELFNAFNHANFGPPDIRREAATFGRILTAGNERIMQFGLKVYF